MRKIINVRKKKNLKILRNERGLNYPDGNFNVKVSTHVNRCILRGDLIVNELMDNTVLPPRKKIIEIEEIKNIEIEED